MLPTLAICAMVKDEGRYLAEWIAFHAVAGVTSIRLYDNGSRDETHALVARIGRRFQVDIIPWTHIVNTYDVVQRSAYLDGARYFAGKADFVAFIDADEFVFCEDGCSLPAGLSRYPPDVGAVGLNQRTFGSSGLVHRTPGLVTSLFTWRASDDCPEHLFFKTIARPDRIVAFNSAHSVVLSHGHYVFSDGSGVEASAEHPGKAVRIQFGPLRLHHYPLKSLEEYRLKQARFGGTDLTDKYDESYFKNRLEVTNQMEDRTATLLQSRVIVEMERLCGPEVDAQITAAPTVSAAVSRSGLGINRNLIFDIGMSEGNDTQFYLDKGFDVIGVEADPIAIMELQQRFPDAIADGRLSLHHRAAASRANETLPFFHNMREQHHSCLDPMHADGEKQEFSVRSIDWQVLVEMKGVPYYVKIDIERSEAAFLASMSGTPILPPYISVACHSFGNIELLFGLGYRKFKLVNQTILFSFRLPNPPLEGLHVASPDWQRASGPFGREAPGDRWYSFIEIAALYDRIRELQKYPELLAQIWFDCHATTE
jgi:FkbM family methyltransferase